MLTYNEARLVRLVAAYSAQQLIERDEALDQLFALRRQLWTPTPELGPDAPRAPMAARSERLIPLF
jgi:hypothetical protein